MPILSLAALTILDAGPAGQIRAAASAGFDHVGLRLMPLLSTDETVVGLPDKEKDVEQLLAATGLRVLEIGVFPIKPQMAWDRLEEVLTFSGKLGARYAICPVEDDDIERRAATFRRFAEFAATAGLTACLEFNPYSACPNLHDAMAMLDQSATKNAGLCLDVLHLSRSGDSPEALTPDVVACIKLVHLCDAARAPAPGTRTKDQLRGESRTARLLPGGGELWLPELLTRLPADVPLSIEAPTAAMVGTSAADRAQRTFTVTTTFLQRLASGNPPQH
jgi:sugar phosphate isomerase/epimerase